jgi:ABC-type transporter Mla subunit MlaD
MTQVPEVNEYEIIGRLVVGQAQLQEALRERDAQLEALTRELERFAAPAAPAAPDRKES